MKRKVRKPNITEKEFQERSARLRRLGLTPTYNTLKEKQKAEREMNKFARKEGFPLGSSQASAYIRWLEKESGASKVFKKVSILSEKKKKIKKIKKSRKKK